MNTPKREKAASAHTKYTRRAAREIIQPLVIGKYNIAAQLNTSAILASRIANYGRLRGAGLFAGL